MGRAAPRRRRLISGSAILPLRRRSLLRSSPRGCLLGARCRGAFTEMLFRASLPATSPPALQEAISLCGRSHAEALATLFPFSARAASRSAHAHLSEMPLIMLFLLPCLPSAMPY